MAHRTSAASLHAARVVLKEYELTPRPEEELTGGKIPGLKATEAHLAVIIDYATNIFELVKHRPEMDHWIKLMKAGMATAPQIAGYLKRLAEGFEAIPKFPKVAQPMITALETPKEFGAHPVAKPLSKAALEASRFIFYYYSPRSKRGVADLQVDRMRVAILVETSMNLSRVLAAEPLVRLRLEELKKGQLTPTDVRKTLRTLGVLLEYLPNYIGDRREEELKLL